MNNVHAVRRMVFFCCIVFVLTGVAPSPSFGEKNQGTDVESSLQNATSRQEVEAIVARLSDSEIRQLVISRLDKNMPEATLRQERPSGLNVQLQKWLHALDEKEGEVEGGGTQLLPFFLRIPGEMWRSLLQLGDGSLLHTLLNLLPIILAFGFGGAAEWFSRRLLKNTSVGQSAAAASVKGEGRFWGALVALLPSVVHLTVFAFSAVLFFLLFAEGSVTERVTFMALLGTVVGGRGVSLVSIFLCRPDTAALRLLPMDDQLAAKVHQGFQFFVWYTAAGLMLLSFLASTGMEKGPRLALGAVLG
ncbi:MAG: hypothetical protein ACWGOX_03120, partial [Desulforhopalus sp.]